MRKDVDVVFLASDGIGLSQRLCQLCLKVRLGPIAHHSDIVASEAGARFCRASCISPKPRGLRAPSHNELINWDASITSKTGNRVSSEVQ